MATAFSVADSTSSEAEQMSQRRAHTEDTDVASQTAINKVLLSTAHTYRTQTKHKRRQASPLPPPQLVEIECH